MAGRSPRSKSRWRDGYAYIDAVLTTKTTSCSYVGSRHRATPSVVSPCSPTATNARGQHPPQPACRSGTRKMPGTAPRALHRRPASRTHEPPKDQRGAAIDYAVTRSGGSGIVAAVVSAGGLPGETEMTCAGLHLMDDRPEGDRRPTLIVAALYLTGGDGCGATARLGAGAQGGVPRRLSRHRHRHHVLSRCAEDEREAGPSTPKTRCRGGRARPRRGGPGPTPRTPSRHHGPGEALVGKRTRVSPAAFRARGG